MDTTIDDVCSSEIAEYLFDKVWNEPTSEYRTNIVPVILQKHSSVGSVSLLDGNLKLPDNDAYYIWHCSSTDLPVSQSLLSGKWYSLETIVNEYQTIFNITTPRGRMLHKGSTYIYLNNSTTTMFIVARKTMYQICADSASPSDIFVSIYYDSDHAAKSTLYVKSTAPEMELTETEWAVEIETAFTQTTNPDHMTIYVDGVIRNENTLVESRDSYIDILVDKNVEYTFTLDLPKSNDDPAYYSKRDKRYKELIHIPRELNKDNCVITGNTCDFYVYNRNTGAGLYLQRANVKVTQVTHNDMALDMYVLDAYRDYLHSQEILLKVIVRKHDKNNVLIRDANYIDLLYSEQHSDADIVSILLGEKQAGAITFWTAEHLEQSKYVEMMYDTPNLVGREDIPTYVEALGYYHVAQFLSNRVLDFVVTDSLSREFTASLPPLYRNTPVTGILYNNGKYIPYQYYYIENMHGELSVSIDENILLKPGDKLTIVLYLTGDNETYHYTTTARSLSFFVPFTNCDVYIKQDVISLTGVNGVLATASEVYQKLEPNSNQYITVPTENGCKVVLSTEYVNKDVYICNQDCCYRQSHDLSHITNAGKPIAIPLYTSVYGERDSTVPILNITNLAVYLNNKYLVRDVDYTLNKVVDSKGRIAFYEVIVQTMDAFVPGKADVLDVHIFTEKTIDISTGHVLEYRAQDVTPINLSFPNIGLVHVFGRLERSAVFKGTHLQLPEGDYEDGSIFEVKSDIHKTILAYLDFNSKNLDDERIKVLNDYFSPMNFEDPDLILLQGKNRVYSVFMAKFIYDLVTSKLVIPNEPDERRMEAYIKPYFYIRDVDVCYQHPDGTYLEFYPQYVNYAVDPAIRKIIDKYVDRYLPKNKFPSLEAVSN